MSGSGLSGTIDKKAAVYLFSGLRLPWLPEVFLSQSHGIGEEKPLVQAVENLRSMPRLIDIENTQ